VLQKICLYTSWASWWSRVFLFSATFDVFSSVPNAVPESAFPVRCFTCVFFSCAVFHVCVFFLCGVSRVCFFPVRCFTCVFFSCAVFHVCVSSGIMPPGGSSNIADYGRLCGNDLKAFCDKENVSLVILFWEEVECVVVLSPERIVILARTRFWCCWKIGIANVITWLCSRAKFYTSLNPPPIRAFCKKFLKRSDKQTCRTFTMKRCVAVGRRHESILVCCSILDRLSLKN